MKVWDLHSDTLSELRYAENDRKPFDFYDNPLQMDLRRMKQGDYLLQCFAVFVNLSRDRKNPLYACLEMVDIFNRLMEKYPEDLMQVRTPEDIRILPDSGKIGAMLTIEEGAVCMGDVRVLRCLYRLGVRMMSLTWNYDNELGSPNDVPGDAMNVWPCSPVTDKGLTETGIEFLAEMEKLHMIVDVSHLSDGGFWDVAKYAKRPFVASHSDARAVCGHVRNLTDDMIRTMGERGGLVGLNYCASFLDPCDDRDKVRSRISDMAVHARHIMNVGGSDILALGSDFDGIEGDLEIAGAQDMPKLAQGLEAAGFTIGEIEKIFHGNAMRFFEENL